MKNLFILWVAASYLFFGCVAENNKASSAESEGENGDKCAMSQSEIQTVLNGGVDFSKTLLPAPLSGKFIDENYYIWCGALTKGDDGTYHLFYSRWDRKYGHYDWVRKSEVAHAVSNSPTGPWKHKDAALPARGKKFWDGSCTHNPTVHKFGGKYYIYYTGNVGDEVPTKGLNWTHRNNQRIGVAVAETPNGPWTRFDKPIIDVSADDGAPDALCIANPSVTQMNDGRYLMVYKAVAKQKKLPFGGPVVHLTAIADKPEGPFVKQLKPIMTSDNPDIHFPAEDPYIWNQNGVYYAIVKDMRGAFTPHGQSLVLFFSKDGFDWKLAKNPLVSTLQIKWENGETQKLAHLERPQLYFENGIPKFLILAADVDRGHSFNLEIPLVWKGGCEEK